MLIFAFLSKLVILRLITLVGDLPECARLSGNSDDVLDDRDLQRALEDSSRDAKKQRQQNGKYAILSGLTSHSAVNAKTVATVILTVSSVSPFSLDSYLGG